MIGYCYAMVSLDEKRVKIGWSSDPIRRLGKVNTDTAIPVRLAGIVPATKAQEADLLAALTPWKIHRSWHRNEGAVASYVSMLPPLRPRRIKCEPEAHPLRRWRSEHGRTLSEIAALTNVVTSQISQIETRARFPSLELAAKLSLITKIPIEKFARERAA